VTSSDPRDPSPAPRDPYAAHPVATIVVDPAGLIAAANGRAEMLLNMARSALIGSPVERVLRLEDQAVHPGLWHTDKPLSAYDLRVHAGRTAAMDMDVVINPLSEREGWRIIALHVHGQAQAMGLRSRAQGSRSATGAAAILAHEIKNPLSGIRGAAQLLEGEVSESNRALTKLICDEVDRIAALIDRMQHFTSEQPLQCAPANIYPLLDRSVELASAGFARDIPIQRNYDPSLPFARVNGDALIQVMINLVKNAAEAIEGQAGGTIQVTTAFRHGLSLVRQESRAPSPLQIEVQVVDNGPGVPEAIRDVLFNPFISNKRSGQGLGLALVDKLMRDMNGLVQYERDNGQGRTIFRLLLPMGMD
jgi:two-component system, NtrC family, nitrogen regulation sensor histidine kinase GlnL